MQSTTETRLKLEPGQAQRLDQMAAHYGSFKRKLYARIAAKGGSAKSHKTDFCRTHGISSRTFNAMAVDVQGAIDAVRELLKEEKKTLQKAIARRERQQKERYKALLDIAGDRVRYAPAREAKLRSSIHDGNCKLQRLKSRFDRIRRRIDANVPGICFGSRKLFRKQHTLDESGFASFDAWRTRWGDRRSHDMFFVGSKDETAGNLLAQLRKTDGNTYSLTLRVPDRLRADGIDKHLVIGNLTFGYDRAALDAALEAGIALSWRLHRDERGWRAIVAFDHKPAERVTLDAQFGVIGIDFNADHLAVTETDPCGNLLKTRRYALLREDASSGHRESVLSDALTQVVAWAKEARKPIVGEELDFTKKKKTLAQLGAARARTLAGLPYAKYRRLLEGKCFRAGVELIRIDPAYTSTIGAVKYARKRGWSVHAAAAGVIARRGQKLGERLPGAGTEIRVPFKGGHHVLELPARKARDSRATAWAGVHTAYRGRVRELLKAARNGRSLLGRSAKGTTGGGDFIPQQDRPRACEQCEQIRTH
jgi:IS605 OrfB family transposase